ncbi:dienelactone hydrolase family protein [Massilia sp. erpn]|uniref:dienelactone hydrolase family protein n=1 Tax=Massilia sp. erpn TaxID=2738142 RepID=UPI002106732C|nr:dienelactone hydrolase family protein [Massilia sp. erpn]UTY56580.1 dienelactone hydrolase family protein [Massilia sp. erpn]
MDGSSKWIDIAVDDGNFGAYLALPRGGAGPGIVLLQEIFGVNAHIRSVAEQYAADGYVVLAPDLFWRQRPRVELGYDDASWAQAAQYLQQADLAQAQQDVGATAAVLRGLPGVGGKIGVLGFCFGGRLAYLAAANGDADAAIAYYGGRIQQHLERAGDIRIPLLLHFGGKDAHIPPEAVRSIAQAFDEHENVAIHLYQEAEHGFNCPHRASYHQRSAAQAHGETLVFLSEHL